jgi:formylglycine-generating enzyme required for sulfatase activity
MGSELQGMIAGNRALIMPEMVTIQGGTFPMGSLTGEADEQPVHTATISTFNMGRTQVTNEMYQNYLDRLGANHFAMTVSVNGDYKILALGSNEGAVRAAVEKTPLVQLFPEAGQILTLGGVKAFSDSLTLIRINANPLQKGFDRPRQPGVNGNWFSSKIFALLHGCDLPTEWQWKYAATVVVGQESLREYATISNTLNHNEVHYGEEATADVDDLRYPSLENGLRHMTGNVWEWMTNYYCPYPEGDVVDPMGPATGQLRSIRGGSWNNNDPRYLRAGCRDGSRPGSFNYGIGFRVVLSQDFKK